MERLPIDDVYPMTSTQVGMIFHSLLEPSAGVYVEQLHLRVVGPLDAQALAGAWQAVVDHHPILRTSFVLDVSDRPLQVVHRSVTVPVESLDWRSLAPAEQQQRLHDVLEVERVAGFDLDAAPLLRIRIIRREDELY